MRQSSGPENHRYFLLPRISRCADPFSKYLFLQNHISPPRILAGGSGSIRSMALTIVTSPGLCFTYRPSASPCSLAEGKFDLLHESSGHRMVYSTTRFLMFKNLYFLYSSISPLLVFQFGIKCIPKPVTKRLTANTTKVIKNSWENNHMWVQTHKFFSRSQQWPPIPV